MPSISRFAAGAAFICSASASAIGSIPSQTIAGFGAPLFAEPTEAPKFELVKARLQKKAVTNVCTEWTIPGGFGQPECFNSETCLFTSASDIWYEGCGQTSIAYNWITECYPYPKAASSSPPVSVTYCPATAPACGYYAFIFGLDQTAWNLGCSTVSYSLYVELLPSVTGDSSSTDVVLLGGGGSSITESVATTTLTISQSSATGLKSSLQSSAQSSATVVFAPGASLTSSAASSTSSSSTASSQPNIGSHASSASTPTGAIVGGVVGGIAVIAFVAFLIWFFLRKRKQDKAAAQAHEAQIQANQATIAAGTAYQNNNRISEIGGTMKPPAPHANTYVPPPSIAGVYGEKPAAVANSQEVYRPQELNTPAQPHSPPPVYASPTSTNPPTHYTELEHLNAAAIARPMSASPSPTGNSQGVSPITTPTPQQQYQHMSMVSNASELSSHNIQPPQPQQSYLPRPGFQEMATSNAAAVPLRPSYPEMPSSNAAIPMRPAVAPPAAHEMNAPMQQAVPMRPAGPPAGMPEMSGYPAASGGVNRPPQAQAHVQRFDMNGAPMGEYQELE